MDELPLTDAPSFVFVNGKKYVLADTEETGFADEPLSERWQNLQPSPRYLPATLWFYLYSFGTISGLALVGWIFALMGMALCFNVLLEGLFETQHLFVALFPLAGIGCMIGSIYPGHKVFLLLRDGEIGRGYFLDIKPTGMSINEQPVMQLRYRLVTSDNEELETFTKSLNTEHATKVPVTPLLYNPLRPQTSLALDDLPTGISFDQSAGTFRISVLRCVLPFLFCTAFAVELAVLCYAIFIGGFIQ